MPKLRPVTALLVVSTFALTTPQASRAQVNKGNQILINRGFQVQGMISNFDPFHLTTYSNANYTAMNWIWDSTPSAMGTPPGFPWARWARTNSPSEMPPLGSESSYMNQFMMLQLGDEWELNTDSVRSNLVAWFNAVRSNWPNTILFHNNYGGQVGDSQLGDFIVRAQPDMICFDSYPFRQDGSGNPSATTVNWYGDLRRYREFAKNNNIPLATYMQTYYSASEGTRSPSPSELRLQHFAALAFNAKALIDFTFNGGSSAFFTNSYGGDTAPNALYYEKADVALKVRNFGKTLVLLKPVNDAVFNTYTTGMLFIRGRGPAGNLNPFPIGFYAGPGSADPYTDWAYQRNDPYLTNNWTVTNKGAKNNGQPGDVIISWFKVLDETYDGPDYSNEVYMLVVNGLSDFTGTAANCLQEIRLNFANSFLALEMINPTNGTAQVQTLPLTNGLRQLVLNLNGGEGALFKFSDGAPFVGTQVAGAPVITAQPSSRTNLLGTDAAFSSLAAGSSPLKYQWQFNGTNINGATTNTYTRSNAQSVDAGNYTMVASNALGMATSSVAVLTVNYAPQISTQPKSRTVAPGSNVLFTVVASGVPGPLTYQWRVNGTNIAGATTSAYTRTNAQSADAGIYSVVVANSVGSTTSSNAALLVNGAPVITVPPHEAAVLSGAAATFTVSATGATPIAYQWQKDGISVTNGLKFSGAANFVLTVSNVQSADLALYSVVLSNQYGMTSSVPVGLAIATPPSIVTQPQSATNNASTTATFGVAATGNGLSYRWQRAGTNLLDGGNIAGSGGPALAVANVSSLDATNYVVVITNAAGSVTSAPASLTVIFAFPFQEPFNYPAGSVLSNQMSPDFLTWTDVGTTNAGPVVTNVSGSLDVTGLATSSGNSIRFGGLGKSARLSFVSGHPVTNGTLYFSFALKVMDLTGANASGGFLAGFNNSIGTQVNTPTVVAPRLYLRTNSAGFNLGLAKSSDTTTDWVWDNTTYSVNQTVFVVGSYTFNSVDVSTDDFCKLWINPNPTTFGAVNPPSATLTALNGNDIGANQIASFVFFQRSSSVEAAAMIADELRIDTTWAGVTPAPTPTILTQPSNRTNSPGTSATFTVAASGTNVKYQWLRNGVALANAGNISGATTASLSVSSITQSDAANYSVVVSTGGGVALSAPALLVVNVPPTISMQPVNQSTNVGGSPAFTVTAMGTVPLSFQWRFNGTNVPGATASNLGLLNVQRTNAGSYSAFVTNLAGAVVSSNAALTVYPITPVTLGSISVVGGLFQMRGTGDPGQFIVQGSSNLSDWTDLTNVLGADGTFDYAEGVTNAAQRFFRARLYP